MISAGSFLRHFVTALVWLGAVCLGASPAGAAESAESTESRLVWEQLPDLPEPLGVAGPFVGVHNDALIVAGGAHFPQPVWERDKVWLDTIEVLIDRGGKPAWITAGRLPRPLAYGAAVSTSAGVLCLGGNDAERTYAEVFLLKWDAGEQRVQVQPLAPLPEPRAHAAAAILDQRVWLIGGQANADLSSATASVWTLPLGDGETLSKAQWQKQDDFPGKPRAFHLLATQHNGYRQCLYLISGRRTPAKAEGEVEFLRDTWVFDPDPQRWRRRADAPRCVMAGHAIDFGQSHLFVLGGAAGDLFFQADELRDQHPGFPKQALAYHTITDRWTALGKLPANQVTTSAVRWNDRIVIPTGEVRPRVRSPEVWSLRLETSRPSFGSINYAVLFGYLLSMVGIGVYFAKREQSTDQYFRGGSRVPWWAAGCSIFATMLSSLTFTGIPSKAFAQDWVYAVGNFMIPVVAVVAVSGAMPFFRQIDATSAYEYLEKRFSRGVRWFGSACFTLFHLFRMAVVMSLTALALAVATPLEPLACVLLMGVLSILYCTLGGIEAVIWTDTVQTVVLLGGALLALGLLITGTEGGWSGFIDQATAADKFRLANLQLTPATGQLALWVVILGGIGQNLASYTADQAVVQRYMTTPSPRLAARSIWTNAVLTIPATLLFFGLGSALFVYYQSHPEKLDPTILSDQVFPLFIAREMPIGLAGLIVAGIFAAAQSTVSTSMNSTATTIVTDFLRPLSRDRNDASYLRAARWITLSMGTLGTFLAIVFIDPEIKSLFEIFIIVIGLFMGVLGGLFLLGALTQRANAGGAICGALIGAMTMIGVWGFSDVNGYLYTAIGMSSSFVTGYALSWLFPAPATETRALTLAGLWSPQERRATEATADGSGG